MTGLSEVVGGLRLDTRRVGRAAALAALYLLLDLGLRRTAFPLTHSLPWYPAAGVGVALLAYAPAFGAAALVAARLLLIALSPQPWGFGAALCQSVALVGVYAVGTALLRRKVLDPGRLWSMNLPWCLAALLGTPAVAAAAAVLAGPAAQGVNPWLAGLEFWAGDASGILVLIPLFAALGFGRRRQVGGPEVIPALSYPERFEVLGFGGVLLAFIAISDASIWQGVPRAAACLFIPSVWAAARWGLRGAAITNFISALGLLIALGSGLTERDALFLQAILIGISICGLLVGALKSNNIEGEERYWQLLASAHEGVWRVDQHYRTLYVNARMAEILDATPEELVGRPVLEFIAPEEHQYWSEQRSNRLRGAVSTYEITTLSRRGQRRRCLVTATPVMSSTTGLRVGAVAMVADITPLREEETRRRAAEARETQAEAILQAAFRDSSDPMVLFRDDDLVVDVNDAWCVAFDLRRDATVGRRGRSWLPTKDPGEVDRLWDALREQGLVRDYAWRTPHKAGTSDWHELLLSIRPARLASSTYYLCIARDVTAQRRLSRQAANEHRLHELGQLAGGVVHDFNNLLAAVGLYAQLLEDELPKELTGPRADVARILASVDQGRQLGRRVLGFGRPEDGSGEPKVFDLTARVAETQALLKPLLGSQIHLDVSLPPEPLRVRCSAGAIDQVLMNLAVNARDAMPEGGRLAIRVDTVSAEAGAALPPNLPAGDYAVIEVRDSGVGMDAPTLARVFEPFFSTKPRERGTGLGLAIVHQLLHAARGGIQVESRPGAGSRFTTYWPLVAPDANAAGAEPRPVARTRTGARILLVEDSPELCLALHRLLSDEGFDVTVARNGGEALRLAAEGAARPDVVLSDVGMPDLSGHGLARALADKDPLLPVVLMTGDLHAPQAPRQPNVRALLQKPFGLDEVITALTRALSRLPQAG